MNLWRRVAIALGALAVPPVVVATALLALAHPWAVDVAYALPGFPEPRIEISDDERSRLAAVGVRAIQPWSSEGIDGMREAQRDSGETAFVADELRHFEDVRNLVGIFLLLGAIGLALIALAAAVPIARPLLGPGLRAGAKTTLGAFVVLSLLMLVGFGTFFDSFHEIFFEGDSWRLPFLGTVRSLFPDEFWAMMGGAMAVLALAQAAAILLVMRARARRAVPT